METQNNKQIFVWHWTLKACS